MGLLVQGTPLTWRQALAHIPYVKKHGLIQLLNVWKRFKDRCDESFLWGDEVTCAGVWLCAAHTLLHRWKACC